MEGHGNTLILIRFVIRLSIMFGHATALTRTDTEGDPYWTVVRDDACLNDEERSLTFI
jgi:hypothetical protein